MKAPRAVRRKISSNHKVDQFDQLKIQHYDLYLKVKKSGELSLKGKPDINYIRKNTDTICWDLLINNKNVNLTDDFVEEFIDHLPIVKLYGQKRLSSVTIEKFKTYIDYLIRQENLKSLKNGGYVFAPYIPLTLTVFEEFAPRENLASRYSTRTVNSTYYTNIITQI